MGIMSLIRSLFGVDAAAPPDAMKLHGTTEATLARSLSALLPDERGWITFAEARSLFSTTGANTHSEKWTRTAEKTSRRSGRSSDPPSTSCRPRDGSILYAGIADEMREEHWRRVFGE